MTETILTKAKNQVDDMVTYEYPLNEKIRTLLRLEELFNYTAAMINQESTWSARTSIHLIIELINFFERGDLKGELIKELEKQTNYLLSLKNNSKVDSHKLDTLLEELRFYSHMLQQHVGKVGQQLKEIELINVVRQRIGIPGGSCYFDLPSLYEWLQQPAKQRTTTLKHWLSTFSDVSNAINCILNMLRNSSEIKTVTADNGFFQQTLEPSHPCQLVHVNINKSHHLFPEISGGKHRLSIRFLNNSIQKKPEQTTLSFTFKLKCCCL